MKMGLDWAAICAGTIESIHIDWAPQPRRVRCAFCGSSVVLPDNGKCPNCGAAL